MKFLFVTFLLPLQLLAQDITGVWTGTLYSDSTQFIRYELAISEYNGRLSGYSHTIFVIDNVENIGVKSIKIKKAGKEFFVEDDELVYNNYTSPPPEGIKQYSKLVLSQNDTTLVLMSLENQPDKGIRRNKGKYLSSKEKENKRISNNYKTGKFGAHRLTFFYDLIARDKAFGSCK